MKTEKVIERLEELSGNKNLSKDDQAVVATAAGLLKDYDSAISNLEFILENYDDPADVVKELSRK